MYFNTFIHSLLRSESELGVCHVMILYILCCIRHQILREPCYTFGKYVSYYLNTITVICYLFLNVLSDLWSFLDYCCRGILDKCKCRSSVGCIMQVDVSAGPLPDLWLTTLTLFCPVQTLCPARTRRLHNRLIADCGGRGVG